MIKLNFYQERFYNYTAKRFGFNKDTSVKAYVLKISVLWRAIDQAVTLKAMKRRFFYSDTEKAIADLIIFLVSMLFKLGCKNPENLIRKRIEELEREASK